MNIIENMRLYRHSPIIAIVGKEDEISKDITECLKVPTVITSEIGKIEEIISIQKKKYSELKNKYPDKFFREFPEHGVLIIINLSCDKMKDPIIKQLFFNGRFLNITLIASIQGTIPPPFRENIDFLFIGDVTEEYFEKLRKQFDFSTMKTNYKYLVLPR